MKKLLKYSLENMTILCVLSTILMLVFWNALSVPLRMVLVYAVCITLHEWEETRFPGGFMDLMSEKLQIDTVGIEQWKLHIYQVIYIMNLTILPFVFENAEWLCLAPFYLGIFEGIMHIVGIKIMNTKKPYTPGMVTALVGLAPSVYGIWYIASNNIVDGMEWFYAFLVFFGGFIMMQQLLCRTILHVHDFGAKVASIVGRNQ